MEAPTGQWCAYYYLHDGLGSVIKVVDSTGAMKDSYSYDPYGKTLTSTGTTPNPFRYLGAVWDGSNSLYKMGERYYDPAVCRFTQPDPLGGGYTYANDDPVKQVVPTGLKYHKKHHKSHKRLHRAGKQGNGKRQFGASSGCSPTIKLIGALSLARGIFGGFVAVLGSPETAGLSLAVYGGIFFATRGAAGGYYTAFECITGMPWSRMCNESL